MDHKGRVIKVKGEDVVKSHPSLCYVTTEVLRLDGLTVEMSRNVKAMLPRSGDPENRVGDWVSKEHFCSL